MRFDLLFIISAVGLVIVVVFLELKKIKGKARTVLKILALILLTSVLISGILCLNKIASSTQVLSLGYLTGGLSL
jgi:uncharacterized membrane protein SirB2